MRVLEWLEGIPRPVRWGAVLAWMGVIFYLSAQPDLPHPSLGWLDLAISCSAHAFVYAVLALLLAWAFATDHRALCWAFSLAMLYGLSDEFHQAFVPGRHPDPLDLLCNGAGAGVALGAWAWLRRALQRPLGSG
ncbi:MAG: VanZ family protein [Anaerolineae bacterium]|nr:VanZ family protein [Anaerolineae bacterium]